MIIVDTFVILLFVAGTLATFFVNGTHKGWWSREVESEVRMRAEIVRSAADVTPTAVRAFNSRYKDALLVEDALHEWRIRLAARGVFKRGFAHANAAHNHKTVVNSLIGA